MCFHPCSLLRSGTCVRGLRWPRPREERLRGPRLLTPVAAQPHAPVFEKTSPHITLDLAALRRGEPRERDRGARSPARTAGSADVRVPVRETEPPSPAHPASLTAPSATKPRRSRPSGHRPGLAEVEGATQRTFTPRIRATRLQAIASTVPAFSRLPAVEVRG